MTRDAISSNATPCVHRIDPKGSQHFLQDRVMAWSYTGDVGMIHLMILFSLQIDVADAIFCMCQVRGN